MAPSHRKIKVNFGLKLLKYCSWWYEEESNCYGYHVEANQDLLNAGVTVTQAWCQHGAKGGDTASDTAHREIDIEDVEETDLAVIIAGEEELDVKPEAEKNNHQ